MKKLIKHKRLYLLNYLSIIFLFSCGESDKTELPNDCTITNCHGVEVTCGFGEAIICTQEYRLGDLCRSYVNCELKNGECLANPESKYSECVDCVKKCEALSPIEAFSCEDECREKLN